MLHSFYLKCYIQKITPKSHKKWQNVQNFWMIFDFFAKKCRNFQFLPVFLKFSHKSHINAHFQSISPCSICSWGRQEMNKNKFSRRATFLFSYNIKGMNFKQTLFDLETLKQDLISLKSNGNGYFSFNIEFK